MPQAPTRTRGNGQATGLEFVEHLSPSRAQRRRAISRLVWSLAFAVVGGVVFVGLYASAGSRHPVLAMSSSVPQGARISASDLRLVRVADDPGLSPIPSSQEDSVIGRRAAVTLVPGTLLTPADLSSSPLLGAGEASVGLDLKPGQFPAGLAPGESVVVIQTQAQAQAQAPPASGTPGSPTNANVLVDRATVISVTPPNPSSGTSDEQVTLALPADLATEVVSAASAGQIALAGLGPGAGS